MLKWLYWFIFCVILGCCSCYSGRTGFSWCHSGSTGLFCVILVVLLVVHVILVELVSLGVIVGALVAVPEPS